MNWNRLDWVAALAVLAITACGAQRSASISGNAGSIAVAPVSALTVATPECYALTYSDPRGGGRELPFPIWVSLLPGSDNGVADGRPNPALGSFALMYARRWERLGPDSLQITFSGSFEGIALHVARTKTGLSGRAIWLTDVVGLPEASMSLSGAPEECPRDIQAAR